MDSPYTPPAATHELPPGGSPAATARPRVIGVLGVLNLVFFGIGILLTLFSFIRRANGAMSASAKVEPGKWQEMVSYGFELLTAVLILVAGFALIRNRASAIRVSNRYAIVSIFEKIVNVPLLAGPLFARISFGDHGPGKIVMVVLLLLLYLIISGFYPTLCLILLNRRRVKDWLAAHGT